MNQIYMKVNDIDVPVIDGSTILESVNAMDIAYAEYSFGRNHIGVWAAACRICIADRADGSQRTCIRSRIEWGMGN